MRKLFVASAIAAVTASSAIAGGYVAPVVAPAPVVVEQGSSSSAGIWIPLALLLIIGVIVSQDDGEEVVTPSDVRLKTDITRVGTAANGLPLYHFRYRGLPAVYEGVMAQDVLARFPEAVVGLPGGYMGVRYGMLGLEMKIVH